MARLKTKIYSKVRRKELEEIIVEKWDDKPVDRISPSIMVSMLFSIC